MGCGADDPEQAEAELGVLERVVAGIPQPFVVLDEVLIGVLREGQGREPQGIDHRQPVQGEGEVGVELAEDGQVVADEVVAEQETGGLGQFVELGADGLGGELALEGRRLVGVWPPRAELVEAGVGAEGGFEV